MNDDICTLARFAYEHGEDPIERAVWTVGMHLDLASDIIEARELRPSAYPVFRLPLTRDAVLRRIIGSLIDDGWTPPTVRPMPSDLSELDGTP